MNERAHATTSETDVERRKVDAPGRRSASAELQSCSMPMASGILMRKDGGGDVSAEANEHVDRALSSGGGRSLPDDLRGKFESSLGTDLSSVRVHDSADSHDAASSVAAKAFTVGNDIHFAPGQYDPGSESGQHLIAHEVAHTVQQRGGSPTRQNKLAVSSPGDSFEVAADRAADAMVAGAPHSIGAASIGLAREKGAVEQGVNAMQKAGKNGEQKFQSGKKGFSLSRGKGTLNYGPEGLTGSLKLSETEVSSKKIDFKTRWQMGPGGLMMNISGGVSLTAEATVEAKGAAPKDGVLTGTISGTGKVGVEAKGTVAPGVYVGAPIANLHAVGKMTLKASLETPLTISGTVTIKDNGNGAPTCEGSVGFEVSPEANVTATGSIAVGYDAVVTSGELYEHELKSVDILKATAKCKANHNFATGVTDTAGTGATLELYPVSFGAGAKKLKKLGKGISMKELERVRQEEKVKLEQEKAHRLEHGVDENKQQSHNPDPNLLPEDCTDPKDLEVTPPESVPGDDTPAPPRPKVKTWANPTGE